VSEFARELLILLAISTFWFWVGFGIGRIYQDERSKRKPPKGGERDAS